MLDNLKRKLYDFHGYRGLFDCDCACADYSGVAAASSEANKVSEALGRDQLAEARRQYDLNMEVAKPVVEAQLDTMRETARQGKDYYDYQVSRQRPVEDVLNADAMGYSAEDMAQIAALREQENAAYQTALNRARTDYQNYLASIPAGSGIDTSRIKDVAVPDAVYGNTSGFNGLSGLVGGLLSQSGVFEKTITNQADIDAAIQQNKINEQLRSALSGTGTSASAKQLSFEDFAKGLTVDNSRSTALAAQLASAAGDRKAEEAANRAMANARQGTTAMQNQMIRQGLRYGYSPAKLAAMASSAAGTQGLSLASAANQARDKERNVGYAKKMDVAGLYRGLPGASQGAYGLALNAGNSAVGNNAQAGNSLQANQARGVGTIQNGMNMQINGLLGAANGIQNGYNNMGGDSGLGGLGSLLGGAASFAKVAGWS